MNPYEILNIPETADDAAVAKAYLALVREYPPEREPVRFEQINTAYETLKTARQRVHYELFHQPPAPEILEIIQSLFSTIPQNTRFTESQLKEYMWNSLEVKHDRT